VYVIYTDENVNDSVLSELTVFEENYALLCNTITDVNDPLIKCFMEKKFLTTEEENEIAAVTGASDKLRLLLTNVSSSLKFDDTSGFYMMLMIMKECGGKGTKNLGDHITKRLSELSHISIDDVNVQNDEPNGLFVCI